MLTPQIKYYVIKQKYLELNFEFRKIFNQQTLLPTYNTYLRRRSPYVSFTLVAAIAENIHQKIQLELWPQSWV